MKIQNAVVSNLHKSLVRENLLTDLRSKGRECCLYTDCKAKGKMFLSIGINFDCFFGSVV